MVKGIHRTRETQSTKSSLQSTIFHIMSLAVILIYQLTAKLLTLLSIKKETSPKWPTTNQLEEKTGLAT